MAEHVGRNAVVPFGAGLRDQRNVGGGLDDLGQRLVGRLEIDAAVAVHRIDRRGFHEAVGQARCVRQQVAERDVAFRRHGLQFAAHAAGEHAHVLEAGQIARDRIVQLETPLLVQHHDRRRGERLGHRVEAEDGVRRHPLLAFDVGQAARVEMHQLAAAQDHGGHPGKPAVIDQALRPAIHACQPLGRKADILRFRVHHILLSFRQAPCVWHRVSARRPRCRG